MKIVYLFLFLGIFCCTGENPRLRFLKDNIGKKLNLHPNSVIIKNVSYDYEQFRTLYPYLVINYIVEGCDVCYAKTFEWNNKKMVLPKDSLLAYLFVFRGKNFDTFIKRAIGDVEFPFFVTQDMNNIFMTKNSHIPDEILHNTMFINSEDKICAIGEPINSEKMRGLYLKIISNKY